VLTLVTNHSAIIADSMNTIYTEHQYDMCYPPGSEYHWWTLARNQLLMNILRNVSGGTGALLEVGCGKGIVVKGLHDQGINIRGVELADVKPIDGAGRLVDTGTDASELAIERRSEITGLLLLDVIEHLPEPEEFLKKLEKSFPNLGMR
jgi:2-polyprenyl-3-methyl-5-hydroxy-6-metoxy-1,4-benzoquinol methylase